MRNDITRYWRELAGVMQAMPVAPLSRTAEVLFAAHQRAATVFVVGNGGSAATASHFACDLAKGTRTAGVPPFRVMPLTDNVPLLTAWANDTSYDRVFAEQLSALVRSGDVVIAISASGNSPNILAAAELARLAGATVIAFTGQTGGRLRRLAHITVRVPAQPIEQVEDAHLAIAHSLCVALRHRLQARRYDGIAEAVGTAGEPVLQAPVSEFLRVEQAFDTSAASS